MASLIFPLEWGVNSSSANKGEESSSLKWSEEKIRNICSSLLNPESVSKFSEDVELQGMLMLLESVFRIFKNVKDRHEQTKVAYQTMKHDLVAAKEELCQVKEDLTRHNETTCERCPELEKSLAAQKRKLAHNENQIRSIVNILNFNNTSEHSQPTQKNAVAKAYNLVSQMLLNNNDNDNSMESQKRNVEKRIKHDTTELSQLISPRRKKLKESIKIDALNKENNFNEVEIFCYGSTLVPESVPNFEIPRMDGDKSIPETLCTQNTNIINTDRIDYIQTTPKKLRHDQSSNQRCSPILRSSVRKSAHKSTPGISSNLTEDIQNDHSPKICEKKNKLNTPVISSENDTKSPSLLKIHPERTDLSVIDSKTVKVNERKTEEDEQNASQNNSQDNKKIPADFWKLRQSNDVDMDFKNLNRGGSRKLKQTTLSLGCFAKKQDLCTLKEFNGGIRKSANESDSLLEKINGDLDEEASFQLAIQDSLKENYELAALQNKDTEIENVTESVGEDNDFVLSSPNGEQSKSSPTGKGGNSRLKISLRRKHDFLNKQKKKQDFSVRKNDMDETLFIPLFTSTNQDNTFGYRENIRVSETEDLPSQHTLKVVPETEDLPSQHTLKVVSSEDKREESGKLNNTFDRIPDKISTSPKYKYKRDAVRKREARRKLDGWECEQCKNYYAVCGYADPTELKKRLNHCSRHRDRNPIISSTPPGYWNVDFAKTEDSRFES